MIIIHVTEATAEQLVQVCEVLNTSSGCQRMNPRYSGQEGVRNRVALNLKISQ